MDTKIVEKLKDIGFNSYEAQVYLALLKNYPSTGYEISKNANIPQPRAYDALKSLLAGNIVTITNEKPQKYIPISPKELTQRYKRQINTTIDFLEKQLPKVKENHLNPIREIRGYKDSIEKIKEILGTTKKSIFLKIWSCDFVQIEKELEKAYDKGITIRIVGYDELKTPYGMVYTDVINSFEGTPTTRQIYFISDDSECVFGNINENIVWTINTDIIRVLKNFLLNDIYLLDINRNFPEQLKYFYGIGLKRLKDKISNARKN